MKKILFILSIFSICAILTACGSDSGNSTSDDPAVNFDPDSELSSTSLDDDGKDDNQGTDEDDNGESEDVGESSSSGEAEDDCSSGVENKSSSSDAQPLSSAIRVAVISGDCGFSTQPWTDKASSQVTLKADSSIYFLAMSNGFNWDIMGNVNELDMDLYIDGVSSYTMTVSRWSIENVSLKAPAQAGTHYYRLMYNGGEVCSATMDVIGAGASSSSNGPKITGDCGFSTQPWTDKVSSQVTLKADSSIYFLAMSNGFNWDIMGNVNELDMDLYIDGVSSYTMTVSRWSIENVSLKAPAQAGTHYYRLMYNGGEVCSATMDVLGGTSSSSAASSSSAKSSSSSAVSSSSAKSSSSSAVSSSSAKSSSSSVVSSSSAKSSSSSVAPSSSSVSDIKPYGYYSETCATGACTYAGIPSTLNQTMVDAGEYGEFLDNRDKKVYRTVTIGGQVWMAQNLDYRYTYPTAQLDSSSFCYYGSTEYCGRYGRLYLWSAVMDSSAKLKNDGKGAGCGYGVYCKVNNKGRVQGICPANWHVPSLSEFVTLIQSADPKFNVDKEITVISEMTGQYFEATTYWTSTNKGINTNGFTALPAGYFDSNRYTSQLAYYYNDVGVRTEFWSSTENEFGYPIEREMSTIRMYLSANDLVNRAAIQPNLRDMASSVRCVHD